MPYPEKTALHPSAVKPPTPITSTARKLHRVRSAAGKRPRLYLRCRGRSRTASTWKAHAPHLHAPARQLNQTRRPAWDKRRGGWLVTLIIFGLALLPMLFNLSERVFYSLADLGGRSSYAETEAPEAKPQCRSPRRGYDRRQPLTRGWTGACPLRAAALAAFLEPGYTPSASRSPRAFTPSPPDDGSSLTMTHDDEAHDCWYQTTCSAPQGGEPELVPTNVQLAAAAPVGGGQRHPDAGKRQRPAGHPG